MMDGAHLGVTAEWALATILGGEPSPAEDERMTDGEFAEWVRSAPEDFKDADYSEASRRLARYFLLVLEDGFEGGTWEAWETAKERWPDVINEDCDFTGFMCGWAFNAARKVFGMPPAQNPALLTITVPEK